VEQAFQVAKTNFDLGTEFVDAQTFFRRQIGDDPQRAFETFFPNANEIDQ